MPSFLHEALLLPFRSRPALALEFLSRALRHPLLRSHTAVRLHATDLGDVQPADRRADLVVVVIGRRGARLAIVVEVQLGSKRRKRFTWPAYLTALRAELECDVLLLVFAPNARVARWCAQPIRMGHPGWELRPCVVGPAAIPQITSSSRARRTPELSVLSAVAHGHSPRALDIAQAALGAVAHLDDELARVYADLVVTALGPAARRALEETMDGVKWVFRSKFARKYIAQGEAKGRAEGEARGEARGEAKGRADVLLRQLALRFGALPDSIVRRVRAAPIQELDRCAERILTAERLADVMLRSRAGRRAARRGNGQRRKNVDGRRTTSRST